MRWTSLLAIYFVIWWVVLFAVLPFGVQSQAEAGEIHPGSEPGAPALPRLLAKLAWTSAISAIVLALLYAIFAFELVALEDLATLWGMLGPLPARP